MLELIFAAALANSFPLDVVQAHHTEALSNHVYVTDEKNYGVKDKWVPSLKGDCEDYALYMKNELGAGELLIVRTVDGELHAVLDVDGYVVDNMNRNVYKLEDMEHKFIARVKSNNPVYAKIDMMYNSVAKN